MERIDVAELSRKNLNLLVVFDTVAELGSVKVAAEKLNLTQSALSHAIGRLRVMFDDPLFVRGRAGFTLTARAAQLVGPVRETLLAFEGLLRPNVFDPGTATRIFRIGFCECSVILFGGGALREVRTRAPRVGLQVEVFDHRSEGRLAEGGLDIGVWPYAVAHNPLRSIQLFSDRFVGVVHTAHPLASKAREAGVTIEDYLAFPHVQTLLYGAQDDDVTSALAELGLTREVAVSAATFAPSFPLLYESRLVVTVPALAALAALAVCRDLMIFELPFAVRPLPYRMVWHRRNDADPALTWLRDRLAGVVQQVVGDIFLTGQPGDGLAGEPGILGNATPRSPAPAPATGTFPG